MNFNFDDYLTKVQEIPSQDSNGNEPINFDEYIQKENKTPEGLRHIARTGSRIGETIAGTPGDIYQAKQTIEEKMPTWMQQIFKSIPSPENVPGARYLLEKLPSSDELKEITSKLTEGFTDPKNAIEEFGDDIVSLATALSIPSKNPLKFQNLAKNLGLATLAKSSRIGAEKLGAGESGQMAAELGTLFLTSLLSKRYGDKYISDHFKKARMAIPEETMLSSSEIDNRLLNLEKELNKGLPKTSSTKKEVLSTLDELRNKTKSGQINADELVQSYHDINDKLSSKKLFDELSKPERKKLKFMYDKLKTEIDKPLKEYGKINPEFYDTWKMANQAFSTRIQARNVTDFLIKHAKSIPGHLTAAMAFKMFAGLPLLGAAAAGTTMFQAGKIINRMAKNPIMRNYYLDVIKNASKDNLPATIKSLKNFQKEIEKENLNIQNQNHQNQDTTE